MINRRKASVWWLVVSALVLWSYTVVEGRSASTVVLVVSGHVQDGAGEPLDGWTVTVENKTQGWEDSDETGASGDPGVYQVLRIDFLSGGSVAETGDEVTVTFEAPDGRTFTMDYVLTGEQVESAQLDASLELDSAPDGPGDGSGNGFDGPTVVLVVSGHVLDGDGEPLDGWTVTVENKTQGWEDSDETGASGDPGVYQVLRIDFLSGGAVAETDDEVTVTFEAPDGRTLTMDYVLTAEQVESAQLEANLELGSLPETPEDVSGDGVINIVDLVIVGANFGMSGPSLTGDVDKNGVVNIVDLVLIAQRFGTSAFGAPIAAESRGRATLASRAITSLDSAAMSLHIGLDAGSAGVEDVAGYAVSVVYDPDLLVMRDVHEGSLLTTSGRTFWLVSDTDAGVVSFLSVALGSGPPDLARDLGTVEYGVVGDREAAIRSLRVLRATVVDRHGRALHTFSPPVTSRARLTARRTTMVGQNYPNPFNPETWVPFQTAEDASVVLRLYDAHARPVRELNLGYLPAGAYVERDRAAYWDGRNDLGEAVASGVYFYEFRAGDYRRVGRMVIAK